MLIVLSEVESVDTCFMVLKGTEVSWSGLLLSGSREIVAILGA